METTAVRRPPANDEGVCGMFINLFRRQHPALARLARNSNAYRQPMVAAVSSSAVGFANSPRQRGGDGWAQKLGSMIQLKVSNTAKNRTLPAE